MGGTAAEPVSPPLVSPQLRRQRSLLSAITIRCYSTLCCSDCDNFFTQLHASSSSTSSSTRSFAHSTSQQKHEQQQPLAWHDSWRLLGSRRKAAVWGQAGRHDVEGEAVLSDDLYAKPTRWRLFFRKLKAETRKFSYRKPSATGFHYDPLSYAMNFDNGGCSWQQQQQQSLYGASMSPAVMETLPSSKLVSISSTSPAVMEILPSSKLVSVSSVS